MPRLEIELTSQQPDGTWTWRAAGARQPKGVVEATVVPGGAKVGDVLKAEAEIELDGINVKSLLTPRDPAKSGPEVLKLIGSQPPTEGVTTSLVERKGRDRGDRGDRGDRPPRRREDGPRSTGTRRDGPPRDRPRGPEGETRGRPRPEEGRSRPRTDSGGRTRPSDAQGEGRSPATTRPERRRPPRPETGGETRRPARERTPRFQPGRAHRDAALAALPEEQRPVAEQVLKGGVRAVREAVAAQKIDPGPMVTLAENLAPSLRAAEWRDRADAALADPSSLPLRELRAIVTSAADGARGEEAREIASKLKQTLATRLEAQGTEWTEGISTALEANRPLRALRQATRSPGPGTRLPAELASRLAQAAGSAMTSTTPPARWLDLLDVVVASPVSRSVRPEGIPDAADEELKTRARAAAGSVPALAPLLGMAIPPPPVRRPVPPKPKRQPPRPPKPAQPVEVATGSDPPAPTSELGGEPEPAPTVEAATESEPTAPPSELPSEPEVLTSHTDDFEPAAPGVPADVSETEQLDPLGIGGDHVDDTVFVEKLEQPGNDV